MNPQILPTGQGHEGKTKNSLTPTPIPQANGFQNQNQATTPTPTPDPTAGWKTYTNQELGFKFRYSSNWVVKTTDMGLNIEAKCEQIFLQKRHNSSTTLEAFLKTIYGDDYSFLISKEQLKINNYQASVIKSSGVGELKTIFVQKNKDVYSFAIENDPLKCPKYQYQYTQILSTFKFL